VLAVARQIAQLAERPPALGAAVETLDVAVVVGEPAGNQSAQPVRRPTSTQNLPGRRFVKVLTPALFAAPSATTGASRTFSPGTFSLIRIQRSPWAVGLHAGDNLVLTVTELPVCQTPSALPLTAKVRVSRLLRFLP
jgi:hypothetical protein